MRRRTLIALAGVLVATAGAGVATYLLWDSGPPDPPVPDEHRPEGLPLAADGSLPDLMLITIDTLRRDNLSAYGYERSTSPFIDSLASQGVRYTHAWSTSSWTLPAVASMITGTWPAAHGLLEGSAANRVVKSQEALDPALPNLPETLQAMGYRTFGLTANGHLDSRFGFGRGFDRYACRGFNISRAVRPVMREFAAELQDGPPFFLWLHIFDPHAPYARRESFREFAPDASYRGPPLRDSTLAQAKAEGTYTPELLHEAVAAYDSEIRHDDALIAELFDVLPRARQAFTVISADHGEEFEDHGGFGHRSQLYDELTRVPLIVIDPSTGESGVSAKPASLVDLFPTLVAAGGSEPDEDLPGRDLTGPIEADRPIFLEVSRSKNFVGVVQGKWKLIFPPKRPHLAQLYDLEANPDETVDLSRRQPAVVDRLTKLVIAHQAAHKRSTAAPRVDVDDDHVDQLKAVGYLEDE